MDFTPICDAFDRVYKKQKICEIRSEEVISSVTHEIELTMNKLFSNGEAEFSQIRLTLSDLQAKLNEIGPLNQVGLTQKDFNLALGKYGKALDNRFNPDLANAYMEATFDIHAVNKLIATHFFRVGQFSLGDAFLQEAQEPDMSLRAPFHEMHNILEQLDSRNLKPAILWARTNHEELVRKGSSLEFNLHELQFIQLLQQSLRGEAIQYARDHFFQFSKSHMGKIQRLMCSMLWADRLEQSPYQDLSKPANWDLIRSQFTKECCNLMGHSYQSALQVSISAGTHALPILLKMASVFRDKKQEWLASKQLPLEIELDKEFQFHSIFACPVSKEQSSVENPPMLMPCGHVLCKQSLQKLSKNRAFKCPYCPTELTMNQCKPIYF